MISFSPIEGIMLKNYFCRQQTWGSKNVTKLF
jgi:hypothetical protein